MSDRLIAFKKRLDAHPVGVGGSWRHNFSKCVLRVTGTKATNACEDAHLCAGLKAGIDGAVHTVHAIWYANSSTEDYVFLLVYAKKHVQ